LPSNDGGCFPAVTHRAPEALFVDFRIGSLCDVDDNGIFETGGRISTLTPRREVRAMATQSSVIQDVLPSSYRCDELYGVVRWRNSCDPCKLRDGLLSLLGGFDRTRAHVALEESLPNGPRSRWISRMYGSGRFANDSQDYWQSGSLSGGPYSVIEFWLRPARPYVNSALLLSNVPFPIRPQ